MHVFVLAGGNSSRMGKDKAIMFDAVRNLQIMMEGRENLRTVVLCGPLERTSLFEGEVWPDPPGCNGVLDVVKWARMRAEDDVLLVACDTFCINREGISWLLEHVHQGGVAVDSNGRRQPTVAVMPKHVELPFDALNLRTYTERLPSLHHPQGGALFDNFNTPDDLERLNGRRARER